MTHFIDDTLPPTFNRLAWSNLAAQSAEQIALAAAPIVAVILLGVGEGQTGLLQTALTLPFVLFAIPAGVLADRMSRRWADGRRRGAARVRAGDHSRPALVRPVDPEPARIDRFCRRVRDGRLQRRNTVAGALAGAARIPARRQRADRTRPHGRLRQRSRIGRCAGWMGGRCAGVRLRRSAVRHRGCVARGNFRARAYACPAPASVPGHQGGRQFRFPPRPAASSVHHPVHLQHRVVPDPGGVRPVRHPSSWSERRGRRHHACDVRRGHGGWRVVCGRA